VNIYTSNANALTTFITSTTGLLNLGTGGANVALSGNAFVSNALTTTNIFSASLNAYTINAPILFAPSNIGGTRANLFVSGNAFVSNSLSATNVYATTLNTTSLNVLSIYGPVGIGSTTPTANLYISGNLFINGDLSTTALYAGYISTGVLNMTQTLVANIGGSVTNLYVIGNAFVSNALSTTNLFATTANSFRINTPSFLIPGAIGGTAANLSVQGNVFVSNALSTTNIFSNSVYSQTINTSSAVTSNIGVSLPRTYLTPVMTSDTTPSGYSTGGTFIGGRWRAFDRDDTSYTYTPTNYAGGYTGTNTTTVSGVSYGGETLSITYPDSRTALSYRMKTYTTNLPGSWVIGGSNNGGATWTFVDTDSQSTTQWTAGGFVYTKNISSPSSYSSYILIVLTASSVDTGSFLYYASWDLSGTPSTVTTALYVQGNVLVSNALSATNVFVTGTSNINSINTAYFYTSNVGIGLTPTRATLGIQGNAFVANALSTTNLFVTGTLTAPTINTAGQIFLANASVGSVVQGASLYVQGNAFVSNALTATNVYVTGTLNAAFINVTTLVVTSNVGVGTTTAQGANLFVQGNVFTSDLRVNNVYISGTLNAATINTFSVIFGSNVGIGTTSAGTTNLYVQGNVFVSGTAGGASVTSTNLIYTVEDLTLRSPHLVPNAINGSVIQAWISGTCNASSQPQRSFWTTATLPDFSNVTAVLTKSQGGVLLPDGRVLFVPFHTAVLGFYQPITQFFSTAPANGLISGNFSYGVLLPTGNVVFCPQTANVGLYNPLTSAFSNIVTLPSGSYSGALSPTGNVIFTPTGCPSNIIHWNYTTGAQTNCYSLSSPALPANPWSAVNSVLPSSYNWANSGWSDGLGVFCATSTNGPTATSTDGLNWKVGTTTIATYTSPTWSPELGLFCITKYSTTNSATSLDGLTWTVGTQGALSSAASNALAWSSQIGVFCAVTNNSGTPTSATSTDGLTWSTSTSLTAGNWSSMAWSPQLGVFCVIAASGTTTSATSRDGKTWTTSTSLPSSNWSSMAWSPQLGLFCAVNFQSPSSSTGYRSAISFDGLTWVTDSAIPAKKLASQQWAAIAWSPQLGLFCAVVNNGTGTGYNYSAMSPDGVNWTGFNNLPSFNTSVNSISWSPSLGVFCAVITNSPYGSAITSGLRSAIQSGSVLLPNGNVLAASPGSSNVVQYNPSTLVGSNLYVGTAGFNGLVLAPNGNVIGVPQNSNIIVINPSTFTSSNVQVPLSNANCTVFFGGGCLIPSGNIVFAPSLTSTANVGSSNVGMFDPSVLTYSNSTATGAGFTGATLVPSGQVIFCPGKSNLGVFDTLTPVSREFCLSPYLNKF
jgi:hypothetical protein